MILEGYILDTSYTTLAVIDTFQSFVWTVRYNMAGDFELQFPADLPIMQYCKLGNYVILHGDQSDRMMIIESVEYQTDLENGNTATVSGRSLESLLDRRVIWGFKEFKETNLQTGIQTLLNENVINPTDTSRKIPNFVFKTSTDSTISSLTFDAQYLGENLYEAIVALCEERGLGFRVLPDYDTLGFTFELYNGINRTYAQSDRPYVMFSPSFDNLLSSNYSSSMEAYKNVILVGGEGEGSGKKLTSATNKEGVSGLARRETYGEANSTRKEEETTEEEYLKQLQQAGLESLAELKTTAVFDAEVEALRQFVYREDFDIGDIVDVVDEYGNEGECRVNAVIVSQDDSGYLVAPSFTMIDQTE